MEELLARRAESNEVFFFNLIREITAHGIMMGMMNWRKKLMPRERTAE